MSPNRSSCFIRQPVATATVGSFLPRLPYGTPIKLRDPISFWNSAWNSGFRERSIGPRNCSSRETTISQHAFFDQTHWSLGLYAGQRVRRKPRSSRQMGSELMRARIAQRGQRQPLLPDAVIGVAVVTFGREASSVSSNPHPIAFCGGGTVVGCRRMSEMSEAETWRNRPPKPWLPSRPP